MKMRNRRSNWILVIAAVAALCAPLWMRAHAAEAPGFDKANALYEAKKFDEAKSAYDALIKSGPLSANLFYNRGNAEWRLGDGGSAVADYERALALEPSHPQAQANLEYVRGQTGAKTAILKWWEKPLLSIDASSATVLLAVCGWVALFCLAAMMLRPAGRMGTAMTMIICVLGGGYAAGALWEASGQATKAIVVAKSAQAREAPAAVAPIQDVLPAGSEVLAPEVRGDWSYCTLPDGTKGWVPSDALEKVRPAGQG